jgi:hypothetical protein
MEWKRLVISDYRNGFPQNPPTSPYPIGNQTSTETPKYDQTYFVSPLRSLIGLRPLYFESWRRPLLINPRKSALAHTPSRGRRALSKVESNDAKETEPSPSSLTPTLTPTPAVPNITKLKAKFIGIPEADLNQRIANRERYGTLVPGHRLPHLSHDLTFKDNCWVQSSLLPVQPMPEPIAVLIDTDVQLEQKGSESVPAILTDGEEKEKSVADEPKELSWKWRQVACCVFCKGTGNSPPCGRLLFLPSRGQWAHVNCLRCSEGIYETAEGVLEGGDYLLKR